MKGTEHFKEIIKGYLDQRAKEDELFRAKYETTARTMDDVITFILNEVKNRHAMQGRKHTSRRLTANRHYHSLTTFEP